MYFSQKRLSMYNNKLPKAAFLFNKMSTLRSLRSIGKPEHISNFMQKFCLAALILLSCFVQKSIAQCDFDLKIDGFTCESSVPLCSNLIDGYVGKLPATATGNQFPQLCAAGGSIENPVWFSFIPSETTVEINITPSSCTVGAGGFEGIQASIFSNCDYTNSVVCFTTGSSSTVNMISSDFIPCEVYYLVIDGYGGSICDFSIDVISGIENDPYVLTTESGNEITGASGYQCAEPNKIYSYGVPDCSVTTNANSCQFPNLVDNDWTCYEWTITPSTYTFLGDSTINYIDIIFNEETEYTIFVQRIIHPFLDACTSGNCDDPAAITIDINFLDIITNSVILCPGELIELCGNMIGAPGIYECDDLQACTRTIDTVKLGSGAVENLGVISLCENECFSLEGVVYCDRINYSVVSNSDCLKTYNFSIKNLEVTIDPTSYPKLDCNNTSVQVSHDVSTNYSGNLLFRYEDNNQMVISNTNFATITSPGDYTFVVYSGEFGDGCGTSVDFTILDDFKKPEFTLSAEDITCDDKKAALEVNSSETLTAYNWSGPVGALQITNQKIVEGSKKGIYNVTVTGTNGCTEVGQIEVKENFPPIDITVNWNDLDCNVAQATLSFLTDITIDSILWTGPNEFEDRSDGPTIALAGVYVLNVFASSGCDYSEIFEILGKYDEPKITTIEADEWACKTESMFIEIQNSDSGDYSFSWFTNNGSIIGPNDKTMIEVGAAAKYFIKTTDNVTGCVNLDSILVVPNADIPSEMNLDVISPLCAETNDGMIEITSIIGGASPFMFEVNTQIVSEIITNLAPDTYEVIAIDSNGCEIKKFVEILEPPSIDAEIKGPSDAIFNENVQFKAIVNSVTNISDINWYNSKDELLGTGEFLNFTVISSETIRMEVIDENGCIVIRTLPIILDDDYSYYMPNVFTPNNDGINDVFKIFPQNIPGTIIEFSVYDRWGNKIHQAENIDNLSVQTDNWGWNGKHNGVNVSQGVYVYFAVVETLGIKKELKGNVTLIR